MLSYLKQHFYNPVCFNCGSLFVEPHLYCNSCFRTEIWPRMSLKCRTIQIEDIEVPHFYLFEWVPGESDLLSLMIYQLKSDRCVKALEFYSEKIFELLKENIEETHMFNCVLPLPGSKKSSSHSNLLAQALSRNLGLYCGSIFIKENIQLQQKKLTWALRKNISVKIDTEKTRELFTTLGISKPRPIYVDDVLTTGHTLKASIKAFGPYDGGCVLTLFYRPTIGQLSQEL